MGVGGDVHVWLDPQLMTLRLRPSGLRAAIAAGRGSSVSGAGGRFSGGGGRSAAKAQGPPTADVDRREIARHGSNGYFSLVDRE